VIPWDDRDHSYDDKYFLIETVTNSMLSSVKNIFDQFGVDFTTALDWVRNEKRSVVLQFTITRKSKYVKQELRKLETFMSGAVAYDHTFRLDSSYELKLVKGGGEESVLLQSRDDMSKTAVVAGGDSAVPPNPFRDSTDRESLDITWIVEQFGFSTIGVGRSEFSIDRLSEECKTPRRNPEVEKAVTMFETKLRTWSLRLSSLLLHDADDGSVWRHLQKYSDMVFSPVVPLFENHTTIGNATIDLFVRKHQESLDEILTSVSEYYEEKDYISGTEASLALLAKQLRSLVEMWLSSVDSVEEMLYTQLEEAIGKRVTAKDFQEFVEYHSRTIFDDEFAPKSFAYTVRRGKNYPDGMLSLEGSNGGPWAERGHIHTTVRTIPGASHPPVSIPLTPATSVEISGDRFLHGWLESQWIREKAVSDTFLVARAHQFSSFMLVVGQMRGASDFLPKQAIILQNKDEVLIPLLTSVLPSAKEFKDSISSLSPEQQQFAKAYREMQLGSSVLGVCVIQIKPQLERLLELPEGALTKEIRLTQDLMDLFVEHQIPSDLLSYDGDPEAPISAKIDTVKGYVEAVRNVIDGLVAKQVKDEKLKKEIHKAQQHQEDIEPSHGPSGSWQSESATVYQEDLESSTVGESAVLSSSSRGSHYSLKERSRMSEYSTESRQVKPQMREEKAQMREEKTSSTNTNSDFRDHPNHANFPYHEFNDVAHPDIDFSRIPKILDALIEKEDKDGALKSTIIKLDSRFYRSRHASIIQDAVKSALDSSTVKDEKNRAMDLLTAISRSGSLPIEASEVHVIVGMTHCFPKQVTETIIEDNINPIEKVEKSLRMIASVIHSKPDETDLLSTKTM